MRKQTLSFNCTLVEKEQEKNVETVTLTPEFHNRITELEDEYDQIIQKKNEVQETLIHELYSEKKEIVGEFEQIKINSEFSKNDIFYYKKWLTTLDKQNETFQKEVEHHINRIQKMSQELCRIDEATEKLVTRINRIERILKTDQEKFANSDSFSESTISLIESISHRRIKLEELKMDKKKIIERRHVFEAYFNKEKEDIDQLIGVLKDFDSVNQLKKNELLDIVHQKEEILHQTDEKTTVLKAQKKYIERKLFELNGNSKGIMSNILKNEMYVIATEELPNDLNQNEADSIQAWNNLLQLNNNIKIATLDFDSAIMMTTINYKQLGWLPQNVRIYNLFNDLLGINKQRPVVKKSMSKQKEGLQPFFAKEENGLKYYYDDKEKTTLTVREQTENNLEYFHFVKQGKHYVEVYNHGYLVMVRESSNGNEEIQRYYNSEEKEELTIKVSNNELEYIRYQEIYFHTYQELLIHWLVNFVEKNSVINLIVDETSPLFNDMDLFKQNGINIVPFLQSTEITKNVRELLNRHKFSELFVLNRKVFNELEPYIEEDCLIRTLEEHQQYQNYQQIVVDSY
ncbi:hypothetical protein [Vagococcus silagei]|uniref:Uncharacterized protein n=1 Tax=Vagococcus silagei TaxID=2508885 RepID=A0A4S3AZQ8_9ENTE|nr:hypothetical protein [Vagococcus silagei]THB60231.1 hypothetical protein ESZ54_11590 [Vagococcus silagei]